MTKGFRRRRDGRLEVKLSAEEAALLHQIVTEMMQLLGEREEGSQGSDDPLARMVGIGSSTAAPDDPALARLLPDAYSGDPDAAGEFRRYTEEGLREQKRAAADEVASALSSGQPGTIVLDVEQAQTWLQALNDVRLVIGTRLEVTEDAHQEFVAMSPDDSRYPRYAAYDWLSYLLETLVHALP